MRNRGKIFGLFLLLCGVFLGCFFLLIAAAARDKAREASASLPLREESPEEAPAPRVPRFALFPGSIRPGEPVTIGYSADFRDPGNRDFQALLLDSGGRRLGKAPFFSLGTDEEGWELKAALLAVPSTAASGPALVRIEGAGGTVKELPLVIEKRDFVSEVIPLDMANTDIRIKPDPQKTAESEHLWALLSRTGSAVYSSGPFVPPVTSTRRTSFFGDRRIYRYVTGGNDSSIHAGVDYGVPTGTEVMACAAGRVVLARFRIATGNSVVIEHMPGVYSLYYHLDRISVGEESLVKAGALVGLSGSTGLATGPHLHWEIRVAGENCDPDAFVSRAVLDKTAVLSHLIER
ncbi:MAG: M23 family metallopeptidase [Treponema sp.]|jgi:murein DD-endopeptidase MepM/ murein hydrolase activator NlpD|nr:M23 family metallopeptidase [Treponema sp.]